MSRSEGTALPLSFTPGQEAGKRQILQRLVLPEAGRAGAEALYGHAEMGVCPEAKNAALESASPNLRDCFFCALDGYVNLFHRARWQEWTGLRQFALRVKFRGQGSVSLYGCTPGEPAAQCVELACYSSEESSVITEIHVPLPDSFPYFFLAWKSATQDDLKVLEAAFTAEVDVQEPKVRIALVVATWRRYPDLARLVGKYRAACLGSKDFAAASHLFIVNNEPNDAAKIDSLADSRQITVLHNPRNVGGAGAFACGARRAMQENFSHILFMDDDADIHEETWFRTLALLRNLKGHWRDQIISGAMFVQEDPTFCHAMQEALNSRGLVVRCVGEHYADNLDNTLRLLAKIRTDHYGSADRKAGNAELRPYAAWWYCVIPAQLFIKYGYPLEIFCNGDDKEFGIRVAREVLSLNGICIWHPAFQNKKSTFRSYLANRNYAITNALHFENWRKNILRRYFLSIGRDLAANRYEDAAVKILAIRDFLHFRSVPRDGAGLTAHVNSWCQDFSQNLSADLPAEFVEVPYRGFSYLAEAAVWLSLGGSLIPGFFRRRAVIVQPLQLTGFPANWSKTTADGQPMQFSARKAAGLSLSFLKVAACLLLVPRGWVTNLHRKQISPN